VSIESIKNTTKHNHRISYIRKKVSIQERANWNIKIYWIKAQVRVVGNELADRLAKAAASDCDV
jgi:ribonuclease HI